MALTADGGNTQMALNFVNTCKSLPLTTSTSTYGGAYVPTPGIYSGHAYHSTMPYLGSNISYFHFNTPNGLSCAKAAPLEGVGGDPWGGCISAITANSNHPGGVNVGFADGSVKFIKDTINLQTWWALGSRNLGEVISADAY